MNVRYEMNVENRQRPVHIKPHSSWRRVRNLDRKGFTRTDMI